MTDRELLELIAAQVGKLTKDVEEIKEGQKKLENTVTKIEQDHGKKIGALLDGYKQNSEQLIRIEKDSMKPGIPIPGLFYFLKYWRT